MAFQGPRCPKCRTRIGLFRSSLLRGKVGIKCPGCGAILKPRLFARAAVLVGLLVAAGYALFSLDLVEQLSRARLVMLFLVMYFLAEFVSVHFISFEVAGSWEQIKTDGETEWSELEADFAELEARAQRMLAQSEPDWTCDSCSETNPHSFDHCWRCSHDRNAEPSNKRMERTRDG